MGSAERLSHALKMKFGLAPNEPTAAQLHFLTSEIFRIKQSTGFVTDSDWKSAVQKNCPTFGTHKYAGVDNSDLNMLLALASKSAGE
jgi:hypothetical protein